ncbi:MAG: endolytic transglycosylase MltG [Gemmatimonadota bacterium]
MRFVPLLLLVAAACTPEPGPPVRVTIPHGSSFSAVRDTLSRHGLLGSSTWFHLLARVMGVDRTIKPGVYELTPGASAWTLLDILTRGEVVMVRFTVPEGLRLPEIASLAEAQLAIPVDSFLRAAGDPALLARLDPALGSAEGYLAPETYTLPALTSAAELVEAMANQFLAGWDPTWDDSVQARGLTRHEAVTLASIVEGEAKTDEERPLIARVYLNRLRIGMPLQADPTIQYALAERRGSRTGRILYQDLEIDSPYNTYRRSGLPPGPIGAPGRRSLEAVMAPADGPWLYFVASGDGEHTFSRTYGDHLRAVAKARRAQ